MKTKIIHNIRVGKPDVAPDTPSHVRGVREGNQLGSLESEPGFRVETERQSGADRRSMIKATARRSTGIRPDAMNPIDPESPNLPPP